jgi:DUF1365 family protein
VNRDIVNKDIVKKDIVNRNIVNSAIYTGQIRHRRHSAGEHAFTYPIAMLYVDLDELPVLFNNIPLWSARRPAPGWFREQDYLANTPGKTLRQRVNNTVFSATGKYPSGPVRLLSHPRHFGIGMNPISCFYCYKADGVTLQYMIAEVTNTPWRERVAYVLPCDPEKKQQHVRFAKSMHVSPFNPMTMDYVARFNTADEKLYLHLENRARSPDGNSEETVTDATLTLIRQPWSRKHLLRLLWQFPFMTLQVAVGIYWQALRLWIRGARFHHHPSPADKPSTPEEIHP